LLDLREGPVQTPLMAGEEEVAEDLVQVRDLYLAVLRSLEVEQHLPGDDVHISPADQKKLGEANANFSDSKGYFTFAGTGFAETNYKFSVNGYLYGDGPVMTVQQGQRVRWYLLDMGDVGALNFHTPHWHGNTVLSHGIRRDTIFLLPLGTETADMVPDAPGLWLFHCHLDDHMEAGMMARYEVLPASAATADTKQRTR